MADNSGGWKVALGAGYASLIAVNWAAAKGKFGPDNAKLSDLYPTPFTPAKFTFGIWGPIFMFQGACVGSMALGIIPQKLVEAVAPAWCATWAAENLWQLVFSRAPQNPSATSKEKLAVLMPSFALLLSAQVGMVWAALRLRDSRIGGWKKALVDFPTGLNGGWLGAATGIGLSNMLQQIPEAAPLTTEAGSAVLLGAVASAGSAMALFLSTASPGLGMGWALATSWACFGITKNSSSSKEVVQTASTFLYVAGAVGLVSPLLSLGRVEGIEVATEGQRSEPSDLAVYGKGQGPWFTCDADGEMAPRVAKTGYAGPSTKPTTIPKLLQEAARLKGEKDAMLVERPCPALTQGNKAPPPLPREQWTTWTMKQYHEDVRRMAKAFIALGFQPFDTVNVWGFNAPEWFISAIAGMYAGGKCGGLYPTDTPDTAAYKVVHSSGCIAVVDDLSKAEKLVKGLKERGNCTRLKVVIAWAYEPKEGETLNIAGIGEIPFISWKAAMKKGDAAGLDKELDSRVEKIKPGHCATLIYTSGTTGEPKAVMCSHDNMIYEASVSFGVIGQSCGYGTTASEERICSYLPLSHVAGTMMDLCSPIMVAATKPAWLAVFFARPYDLKAGTIKDRLSIARPTAFLGVPLVWEKMADKIRAIGASASPTLQKVSGFAKGNALEYARNIQLGGSGATSAGLSISLKILKKVKSGVGLDCCKYALTGAAPIRVDTLEYFGSLGIFINELYGMSECTGVTTVSTDQAHKWGSCGWALPGCEVLAFKVDGSDFNKKTPCEFAPSLDSSEERHQGELCFRGRHIMMGYLACKELGPAHAAELRKKTAETIDDDGWLHSGDKGFVTRQGMTKITGRYKELIIGEGGENIAPVPIEDSVKKLCDGIAEVMMVGDQRKYNVALITIKAVGANGETPGTDDLDAGAKKISPGVTKISQAMKDDVFIKTVQQAISTTNANGKVCPNQAFKIQKFTILPDNFSEERAELTPTKKLKRKVVEKAYAALIEKMYATDGVYIPF